MTWLRRKIEALSFRSFQSEIAQLRGSLTKEQEDGLLSGMYQNQAFKNWVIARETAILIAMGNEFKKPSDEEYLELYGRRKEIKDLYVAARNAYNRRQDAFAKKKEHLASPQASA